ncbi:uncharacterized protein LTR77_006152 [Saxophila tyrrhenica]|uniref:WIBG Mago-binding domain-containing protein n=1 Tax=Saxophila tyrrhenica TaxID=1690608 RepID=A0AAV9P7Y0_9PEZI|nr:hypothetical protein LTR77_006152 [Saxophila tyrrhenica]
MPPKSAVTNSGIRQTSNGESVIPSSTRADGSVRKEIRVKPGYKPPEDVEVYKNRTAEAWKNRGKGGVPGAETVTSQPTLSAAANKNAKRREARKKAGAAAVDGKTGDGEDGDGIKAVDGVTGETNGKTSEPKQEEIDPEAEKAKEARKLAKKLRQARELQEKKDQGSSLLPEQLEKVIKINELVRQLDGLGFDAEDYAAVYHPDHRTVTIRSTPLPFIVSNKPYSFSDRKCTSSNSASTTIGDRIVLVPGSVCGALLCLREKKDGREGGEIGREGNGCSAAR